MPDNSCAPLGGHSLWGGGDFPRLAGGKNQMKQVNHPLGAYFTMGLTQSLLKSVERLTMDFGAPCP